MPPDSIPSSPPGDPPLNWMLMDMNSYFASVEQHLRPELRNRPIGIIPVESESTCIIAASLDAKHHGIKVGTSVPDARRLCPGIILVKARPNLYVQIHHKLLQSVDKCLPVQKVYSIDEWTFALLGQERSPDNARLLATRIKRQLLADFGPSLTCSIGIAPTRLLAKIACELQKPDGLTLLTPGELPDRLDHLLPADLCGIGPGMQTRLLAHGILSVRDLWNLSRQQSILLWGSVAGAYWWAGFHGIDEPEIPTRRHSMSHASVLDPKFRSELGAYGILTRLITRLGSRLRRQDCFAQYLHVHVRDYDGHAWRDQIAVGHVQDTPTLLHAFQILWNRRRLGPHIPFKIGADVTGLIPSSQVTLSLFDDMDKKRRLSRAIDTLNRHWGPSTVYVGSMHDFRHHMDDKIAFGRIPPPV